MRYLFASFLTRFRSPTLQYRLNAGKWLNGTELEIFLHVNKLWEDIEMRDVKINFRMNFYLDILLKRLPNMTAEWEKNREGTPTLVILAAALHWMWATQHIYISQGAEAAVDVYRKHIRSMKGQLTRLAARTTVVFKLLDYVKSASVMDGYRNNVMNSAKFMSLGCTDCVSSAISFKGAAEFILIGCFCSCSVNS
nr:uncharacterized protein LOC128694529 [Cherax quadricarinatus]